ncbi:MAG: hypothetical protein V1492_01490 [Candidatus Micrarchaeota archaeon]
MTLSKIIARPLQVASAPTQSSRLRRYETLQEKARQLVSLHKKVLKLDWQNDLVQFKLDRWECEHGRDVKNPMEDALLRKRRENFSELPKLNREMQEQRSAILSAIANKDELLDFEISTMDEAREQTPHSNLAKLVQNLIYFPVLATLTMVVIDPMMFISNKAYPIMAAATGAVFGMISWVSECLRSEDGPSFRMLAKRLQKELREIHQLFQVEQVRNGQQEEN